MNGITSRKDLSVSLLLCSAYFIKDLLLSNYPASLQKYFHFMAEDLNSAQSPGRFVKQLRIPWNKGSSRPLQCVAS